MEYCTLEVCIMNMYTACCRDIKLSLPDSIARLVTVSYTVSNHQIPMGKMIGK